MSTTRILYTIPNLDTAGSGKALANLVEHLDRHRFEPMVAVSRAADTAVARRMADLGVTVVTAPTTIDARPRVTLLPRARHHGRQLADLGASIWHSFHYLDDYTEPLIARAAGARWVYTKKNMSWNRRSWRLRTALAAAVLAQNTDMMSTFFPHDRRGRIRMVPRGVPVPDPGAVSDPVEVRARLGLPAGPPLVTCVARIEPRKQQALLVQAIARVPEAHLVLAGAGHPDVVEAVTRIAEDVGVRDRVHLVGHVDDVDGLVMASTVVCLPTSAEGGEGCPVALLEAMALGAAVVATDVPGSRDVVRDDIDGRLVPSDDVAALGAVVAELVDDPDARARLGAGARARIESAYSIDREARRHEAVYDAVSGAS